MALAIDASTPALVTSTTSVASLTTASFTPPVGSLLVVGYTSAFSVAMAKPTNTGGTVSWSASVLATKTQNGLAALWLGTVTASAAMTVTESMGSTAGVSMGVVVVTGQAATQNGIVTSSSGAPAAPSITLSPLVGANSLILGVCNNGSNSTVGTVGANQTQTFNGNVFTLSDATNGDAGWMQYDTRINLAAGASDTLNTTASCNNAFVAAEILAAGGGSSVTGAATLAATMGLSASGSVVGSGAGVTGSATLAATMGLTATGSVAGAKHGAATLSATLGLSASGHVTGSGSASGAPGRLAETLRRPLRALSGHLGYPS
jgi:hypothetical protein